MRSKTFDNPLLIAYFVALGVMAMFPASPGDGLNIANCWLYIVVAVVVTVGHLFRQDDNNWLRPDVLFLLGFFIVHYQWIAMALISGLFPESTMFYLPLEANATYGTWLSSLALISWLIGFSFAKPNSLIFVQKIRNYSQIQILAIIVFILFVITVDDGYFSGALYLTVQENFFQTVTGVSAYLITLSEIMTIIVVSMFFYRSIANMDNSGRYLAMPSSLKLKPQGMLLLLCYLSAYLLAFIFAGERGQVIQLVSAIAVIYAVNFRAVRLHELLIISGVSAFLFTGIGIARSINEGLTLDHIFGDVGYWSLTKNLANSSITLYQGIDLIESNGGLFYGQLWLSQLMGVIPFLQSAFLYITDWPLEDINSATKITAYILGANPHTGFGTSYVVDIYMNFGVFGVLVFSFLYGYICKLMTIWISGKMGFNRFFTSIAFISLLFYVSRSSVLIQLRPIVWGLCIIIVFVTNWRQRA